MPADFFGGAAFVAFAAVRFPLAAFELAFFGAVRAAAFGFAPVTFALFLVGVETVLAAAFFGAAFPADDCLVVAFRPAALGAAVLEDAFEEVFDAVLEGLLEAVIPGAAFFVAGLFTAELFFADAFAGGIFLALATLPPGCLCEALAPRVCGFALDFAA